MVRTIIFFTRRDCIPEIITIFIEKRDGFKCMFVNTNGDLMEWHRTTGGFRQSPSAVEIIKNDLSLNFSQ